ncbi:transcriptional regulator%2C y4mF family [uncultured Eubacterium sp.]|nr:transcriptional regulator%2C y4mF family [uncultured Eubacterium sp.]
MIDLYRNIRKFRIEHKMSQDTLAKLTGYTSRSSIAKIEKGEVDLPLSKIEAFADALNVEPSELMGDTWEDDVINSSRLDVAEHFDGDPFLIAKAMEAEKNDALSNQPELNKRDSKQIEEILQQTKDKLTSQEGLMFDGNPVSPEAIESILNAMEIGMEMAKKKNKEKYTPKKYKKD